MKIAYEIDVVAALCDAAAKNLGQRQILFDLAKAQIGDMVDRAESHSSSLDAIQIEQTLRPIIEALSYLPSPEQSGTIRHMQNVFGRSCPSEYALRQQLIEKARGRRTAGLSNQSMKSCDLHDLLAKEIKPRKKIMGPWLLEGSVSMVYAWRGIGKSLFTASIGLSVATGNNFLGWDVPDRRSVLLIDGELPEAMIQERIRMLTKIQGEPDRNMFDILYPEFQSHDSFPNLATEEGQQMVEANIRDRDVVIIDNLSCLARVGKENESESWLPMIPWIRGLRSKGKAIIIVHHSNKSGQQRGTSAREDQMDTVIKLLNPTSYSPGDGARFELHFEKCRHFFGLEAEPFLVHFDGNRWSREAIPPEETNRERARVLKASGLKKAEVARELNLNRSTVGRMWDKL